MKILLTILTILTLMSCTSGSRQASASSDSTSTAVENKVVGKWNKFIEGEGRYEGTSVDVVYTFNRDMTLNYRLEAKLYGIPIVYSNIMKYEYDGDLLTIISDGEIRKYTVSFDDGVMHLTSRENRVYELESIRLRR